VEDGQTTTNGSSPRSESRNQTSRRCRIEHHSTNAASVRSFGERETVKVTIPEVVDDCRVRHRAAALAAVLVRLISCR
jgi:hypothetical protein